MTQAAVEPLPAIGNYDVIDKIADGGMGSIYKARRRDTGDLVAIKTMPRSTAANSVLLKRFEQEFRVASRLDHPHVVRALDYGDMDGSPYLVMEYVEGESLGQKIERNGRMAEDEAIRWIAQIAQALHSAHKRGLVHRDVKPDNILITPDGQAKLADLGLVKEVDCDLNLTRTGRGLGTPHFMAPEQFRNAKNADPRCDIYSLGATLYMLVTGELPFQANGPLDTWMKKIHNQLAPPRQLVPELSDRVDWAIRRAMHPDPDQRPTTCREFVEDLCGKSARKPSTLAAVPMSAPEMWFLVYKDEMGVPHNVTGTAAAIRRSLNEGLLGDAANILAGRSKAGPFEPLRMFAEFRDVALKVSFAELPPEPPPPPQPTTAPQSLPFTAVPPRVERPITRSNILFAEDAPEDEPRRRPMMWMTSALFITAALSSALVAWFVFFRR
jgi:serine/threonine protein kinase